MKPEKTALNVALVGYGYAGATFHRPLIQAVPALRLTHVVSSNAAKVHADLPDTSVVATLAEALPAVDLVVIATPNDAHHPLAREALQAGKHVVVDKPFTITLDEARDLVDLAAARGLMLSVFHNRRWDADFLTLRQQIDAGALGEVNTFISHFDRFRPEVRVRWREADVPGAGALYDLGPHLIDQALVLFGLPQTVWADAFAQRDGSPAVDYAHVVLGWGARRAMLHASMVVPQPGPRFQVHGRDGTFVKHGLDPQEDALKAGRAAGGEGWGEEPPERFAELTRIVDGRAVVRRVPSVPGRHHAYYEGVAEHLLRNAACPVPATEALAVMQVLDAALRSARERRVIELTQ